MMDPLNEILNSLSVIKEHSPLIGCQVIALHPSDQAKVVFHLREQMPPDNRYIFSRYEPTNSYCGVSIEPDLTVPRGYAKLYESAAEYTREVQARKQ